MKTVFTDLFLKSLNKVGRYTDGDTKGVDELPESPPPPQAAKRVAMQAANNALWFVSISIPSFKFNF